MSGMMSGATSWEVRLATLRYPGAERAALERVTLDVPAGECTAVIGPNGAGKSSLVQILLGTHVERTKLVAYALASLLAAAAVAVSGVIGFVGLVVPHVVRMLWGADHRFLLPASVLLGASFAVLADTLARTGVAPTELPVGVVTAFVGVPFFVWLLRRRSAA